MIRLFAIDVLKDKIEELKRNNTEESKILIAQYEREIIILERVALGNLDVIGKTVKEFRDYMSNKILLLEDEDTFEERNKFERAFNAFKKEYGKSKVI